MPLKRFLFTPRASRAAREDFRAVLPACGLALVRDPGPCSDVTLAPASTDDRSPKVREKNQHPALGTNLKSLNLGIDFYA